MDDLKSMALHLLRRLTGRPDASFHAGQLEAIRALVGARRRVLVVQRTGWGKSAVYFIATKLLRDEGRGPTLLVSPLLALMRNQVDAARRMGVRAATINSSKRAESDAVTASVRRGEVDLLLISPERLANPEFRDSVLDRVGVGAGLLVVDEAHCISDWGHDFRPDFRRIRRLRGRCSPTRSASSWPRPPSGWASTRPTWRSSSISSRPARRQASSQGRLVRLLDAGLGLAMRLERLYEQGISVVTVLDEDYPSRLRGRLGAAAPPVLYCAGELSLLGVDGIGVVGSRHIGPEAIEVSQKAARHVAERGPPLVSGGAKGVDSISMAAAYEAGGSAVGVLADSLERAVAQADNRRALLEGSGCLCTPYRPDAPFSAGSAMGRDKIIFGLSRVTLVIASAQGEGGTWAGATEALKKRYGRVAVWMGSGQGPGNAALVQAGGVPIEAPQAVLELTPLDSDEQATKGQMALALDSTELTSSGRAESPTP